MRFIFQVLLYATLILVVKSLDITEVEDDNLIEDIRELGDGEFTVVTHEFDFDGEMSNEFNNLEQKIQDREKAFKEVEFKPVINKNDPHLNPGDELRDFKNNLGPDHVQFVFVYLE